MPTHPPRTRKSARQFFRGLGAFVFAVGVMLTLNSLFGERSPGTVLETDSGTPAPLNLPASDSLEVRLG